MQRGWFIAALVCAGCEIGHAQLAPRAVVLTKTAPLSAVVLTKTAPLSAVVLAPAEASAPGYLAHSAQSDALVPLPRSVTFDARRAALGERLYVDPQLSGDGKVSCRSCHELGMGGSNGEPRSTLPGRRPVPVNVPTVYNVAFDFRYAWNGRFGSIEAQLDFAETSPAAMAGSWAQSVQRVARDSRYMHAFTDAYPDGLTPDNLRNALVEYCRSLITPDSRFDQYLRGEAALSERELRGYEAFRDYGCVSCHQGQNIGGNMYQRMGVMFDYFADRGNLQPADLGRYNATGQPQDRYMFRVPSLRNVEKTAPYFHDGSSNTLEEAVTTMARYQLGRELSNEQAGDIAAFLRTLTGKYRGQAL